MSAFPGRRPRAEPGEIDALARDHLDARMRVLARQQRQAVVEAADRVTPTGTLRLALRADDGGRLDVAPGQFVSVQFEAPGREPLRRPYCPLLSPEDPGRLELLVRLVGGPVSSRLGSLRPGDVVSVRGPMGRAIRPRDPDRELVLLATGVGVAPFLSFVRLLHAAGEHRPVHLYWGLRQAEDVCLVDELDDLAARHGGFRYDITLSQPPPGWTGLRGRITESVPPRLPTLGDKEFVLCGNGAMIHEMTAALSDLGVARRFVHEEPYFNSRHRPDPDVMAEIRRRFVARDLFSPFAHYEAGLFVGPAEPRPAAGNVDADAPSDVGKHIRPWRAPRPEDEPRPRWGL